MSNVIEFLEQIGQTANLRYATGGELAQALDGSRLDPATRGAVLAGDRAQLETLLRAESNVCCIIFSTNDDDDPASKEMVECPT